MATVLIDSQPYITYADVVDADLYLLAAFHGATWRALTDTDEKSRALVTATRILDRQRWKDSYDTFAEREVVQDIIDASIELANYLVEGNDPQNDQNVSQKIQALKAGSVSITYFRGAEGANLRFPLLIFELLRDYLAGGSATLTGIATGTDKETITDDPIGYNTPL